MKTVLKKIVLFILGVAIAFAPFGVFILCGSLQKHIYTNTYYAAIVDKVHSLREKQNQKKIILVGGSNVAFGFDSQLIEEEFSDYKVVNFGLYAMLGTKIMMDLALESVNEGDMVFVIPEIDEQSTSLYFNPNATLKGIEDDFSIINSLPNNNKEEVYKSYFDFVIDKMGKDIITPNGVYQRKNFNSYGDISYDEVDENGIKYRSVNRMSIHYDPTMPVDYSCSIEQSFFDYLNEYDKSIKNRKASLYYAFSPVNEKAVVNKEEVENYYWNIRKHVSMKVVGNPNEYIIDPHYFYDSNYHMNDVGAIYRTHLFIQDIYRDIYKSTEDPHFDIPNKPAYIDEEDIGDDSENASYFTYDYYEDSLLVSGVNESHLSDTSFVIPEIANGQKVIGVAKDAFKNCTSLTKVTLPKTVRVLLDGAFGNCSALKSVYVDTHSPSDIIVSYTGKMTENVSDGFKIYIHEDCYMDFITDYYWGAYSSYFVRY